MFAKLLVLAAVGTAASLPLLNTTTTSSAEPEFDLDITVNIVPGSSMQGALLDTIDQSNFAQLRQYFSSDAAGLGMGCIDANGVQLDGLKAQLPLAIATNVGFGEFNEYVLIANPEPPRR